MNRRLRALLPFVGNLSCPRCGHGFVSVHERMMCLPRWGRPAPCPGCNVLLCYPKWAQAMMLGWFFYVLLLLNMFFAAASLPGWVFDVMIHGFIPLGALTFVSAAWGGKLREHAPNVGSPCD